MCVNAVLQIDRGTVGSRYCFSFSFIQLGTFCLVVRHISYSGFIDLDICGIHVIYAVSKASFICSWKAASLGMMVSPLDMGFVEHEKRRRCSCQRMCVFWCKSFSHDWEMIGYSFLGEHPEACGALLRLTELRFKPEI